MLQWLIKKKWQWHLSAPSPWHSIRVTGVLKYVSCRSNAKQFTNPSMHRKNCELPTVPLRILMRLQKSIQQMRATHVQQGSGDPSVRNIPSKIMAALFSFRDWKCQCRNQPLFSGATNKANILSSAAIPDSERTVCTILCVLKIQTWC